MTCELAEITCSIHEQNFDEKLKKITSCIISLISVESFPICTYSRNTLCCFQVSSQSVPGSDFVAGQDMLSTVYEVIQHVPEQPQQDHQQ